MNLTAAQKIGIIRSFCVPSYSFLYYSTLFYTLYAHTNNLQLTLILRCSHTGTVWFYTSTSNKRQARPKLYTKSLTRDLKLMY